MNGGVEAPVRKVKKPPTYPWGKVRPSRMKVRLEHQLDSLENWKTEQEAEFKLRMEIIEGHIREVQNKLRIVNAHIGRVAKTTLVKRGRGRPKGPTTRATKTGNASTRLTNDWAPDSNSPTSSVATQPAARPLKVQPNHAFDLGNLPEEFMQAFPDQDLSVAPEDAMSDEEKLAWLKKVRSEHDLKDDIRIGKTVSGAFKRCFVFIKDRLARERDRRAVWEFVQDRTAYVAEFRKEMRRGSKSIEDALAYFRDFDTVKVPTMTRGNEHQIYMEIIDLLNDNVVAAPVDNSTVFNVETDCEVESDRPAA
ncbi:hypothetical protein [Microvirga tunisiensis]|uniref:Uncharacterized protein n=1 Tax=Microvirga tunisiensis TaxID=2108360 RepID=A0A5N7MWR9_9HYPH|nr:hypothetical protein [Microvirga tunisiensis]MPR13563.1 hypothetical protein [Microvirga tunisiensis]MPR31413.1 hypothetical protein [Microvirga tunisiensis]